MDERAIPHFDVNVGDVSHSQLVFGNHNTIQTPHGTKVTVMQVGERPVPRLRAMPRSYRPAAPIRLLGREAELKLAASAATEGPLQVYAPEGAGKTALLKFVAQGDGPSPEGVVFVPARRRALDEIATKLYAAFWECDPPFLPHPAEVGEFLDDREALIVLDDCGLDRDDLDTLLELAPRCGVLIASGERTLWGRGAVLALEGLDPKAGLELLERELGHAIEAREQPTAEALVARLDGHPQSLVEVGALVADGRASWRDLAHDPSALPRRLDPAALSRSQRRILELLEAVDAHALGVEHIAVVADVPDAARELFELERRGWVKSGSPRYRLTRSLPPRDVELSRTELAERLLREMRRWSQDSKPYAVADDAEAVEASLELGLAIQRWPGVLGLALTAEGKLAVAASWTSWRRVLTAGLTAARELQDEVAQAYLLHQLGSRSLCLKDDEAARSQLEEALEIRDRLGDQPGADLTRHNLDQLGGGPGTGDSGGNGDGGGRPPRSRLRLALAAFAVVAVGAASAVLAAGGLPEGRTDEATTTAGRTTTDRPPATGAAPAPTNGTQTSTTGRQASPAGPAPGKPPTIQIAQPSDGATLSADSVVSARYKCVPAKGKRLESCRGTVPIGEPIDTTPGKHQFTVTASDDTGRASQKRVRYTVSEPRSTDTEAPAIEIISPKTGDSVSQGERVEAQFTCDDARSGGSGVKTCEGTTSNGTPIDTRTTGDRLFTVTAVDRAGNQEEKTVTYNVYVVR